MKKTLVAALALAPMAALAGNFDGLQDVALDVLSEVTPVVTAVAGAALIVFAIIAGYRIIRRVLGA